MTTDRAFHALLAAPWAIEPSWLPILAALAQRASGVPEVLAAREARPLDRARVTTERDGVAIVPVLGPVFPRANIFQQMSGATSLAVLATDFQTALDSPDVRAILLEIDSPGGVIAGVNEFAAQIRAARGTKPIAAYVSGLGASAAYWIASAAGRVVVEPSALVGSIGVVLAAEYQEAPDSGGYRQIEIVSSNARDKRPDVRTEDGRATLRAMLDKLEAIFVDAVAANRGVDRTVVLRDFGQGGLKVGSEAVASGMADATGTFEEVLAGLAAAGKAGHRSSPAAAAASSKEKKTMSATETAATPAVIAAAAPTLDDIERQHPALAAQLRGSGAAAERARLAGIDAMALPGHETLIAALKSDGKTTPEQAAAAVVAAEKATGARILTALRADSAAATAAAAPSAGGPAIDASAPVAERCKAAWDAMPALRAEFLGSLDRFTAYKRAEEAGTIRRLARA